MRQARVRGGHHSSKHGLARSGRRGLGLVAVAAAITSVVAGPAPSAFAVQATGHDVAAWATGWSWTYAQTFNYNDGNGTSATINENVTYANQGPTTFNGQSAYRLTLSGNITGGSGSASGATLKSLSGSVSGTEWVRRSDLALLEEDQTQNLSGQGCESILCVSVTAKFNLNLSPSPGWRTLDFPLNNGDSWQENETINYSGSFSYDAGSIGGSGSSPLNGSFSFDGNASVASPISADGRTTDRVSASNSDGSATDNQWWSPNDHNLAQEHLAVPLSGSTVTLDRTLSSDSISAPANTITETVTPSLSCAGGPVTVAGTLSTHASGVPVTVTVDKSVANAGTQVVGTTTGANGAYSTTVTAPIQSDGASKNGS
ncbi:MAG TPA: hypothetical protein VG708_11810, partial [Mycobacteriales bacterium]|nr:hypothetical protein [Mycobacteriales bacterium]